MFKVFVFLLMVFQSSGYLNKVSLFIFPKLVQVVAFPPNLENLFPVGLLDTFLISDQKNEEELNVMSRIQDINYNKFNNRLYFGLNKQEQTGFVIKVVQERNKRFSTYFSYCPFKICKFGTRRKATKLITNKRS
ncbi:uncharacterized protein LOC130897302 [Diorhabda carinulata]|uniref:uncharacterized protein LOC130897302 n=1 Tax=Diorhabda carinulata TaxID=1163345 RepID=UPI0025A1EBBC|nr:uncharacterized protein LOC130897302 [Diorhabda carinulata]